MTNEIKEKIEYLKKVAGIYEGARITEIEDYITNLQEEKKEMKDGWQQEIYDKNKVLNDWLEDERKINILQQRIDKAIEYIERYWQKSFLLGTWEFFGSGDELLDILRGDE